MHEYCPSFTVLYKYTTLNKIDGIFYILSCHQHKSKYAILKMKNVHTHTNTIMMDFLYGKWYNIPCHYKYKNDIKVYSSLYILLEMKDTETFKVCNLFSFYDFCFFVILFVFHFKFDTHDLFIYSTYWIK